jgi:hypothetical protein
MRKYIPHLPAIILISGALLRAFTFQLSAIWYDEAVTLWRTTLPFLSLYSVKADNSGCLLLDLLLRPLMAISHLLPATSYQLYFLRIPSLLASFACLFLVWKLIHALQFTPRQQLFAALFAAFLPGLLWIAQDARSYSLLSLVFLGGLWFAINGQMLGLTACLGLLAYCHNTGFTEAGAVLAIAIYLRPWKTRRILISGLVAFIAWIPAMYHILQLTSWTLGVVQPWQPTLTLGWFVTSALIAAWVSPNLVFQLSAFSLGLLSLGLLFSRAWKNRQRNTLLIALLLPVLIMLAIGLAGTNILLYRTLMPMLWPLVLFLGWELGPVLPLGANVGARYIVPFPLYRFILAGAWLALLFCGIVSWRPADRGGHLDQAAAYIRSNWQPGDVILYNTMTVSVPFDFYLSDLPHYSWQPLTASPLIAEPGLLSQDTGDPAAARRVWLVETQDALVSPSERARLQAAYPHAAPLWQIDYLQAASIDVFLVER